MHNLRSKLMRLNKCKYNLYYSLLGEYDFDQFTLIVDHVQADPFAPPSKITISVPFENTGFSRELIQNPVREYAFCDMLARHIAQLIRKITNDDKGSGNSGFMGIRYGSQKIIESNAVRIHDDHIDIKLLFGFPAFGRTIAGKEAQQSFLEELPELIKQSVIDTKKLNSEFLEFVILVERQEWLRDLCRQKGLIAFVANGSILARASSISDKPMSNQKAIPFMSPPEMEVTMSLPDGFKITGMGIPKGITLIAGGGFHGKSTLLSALSHSVYNHVINDGREYCVTDELTVMLRSEEGRFIEGTNIAPFISQLPNQKSSTFFQTENASGSSSQAANIMEMLEVGARVFLIDEDISATNFLIRDAKMKELVPDIKETITPLIAHMKNLKKQGISFIMVTGALGDFMDVADHVIIADHYHYYDATEKAKSIAKNQPMQEISVKPFSFESKRVFNDESISYIGKKGMAFIDGEMGYVKLGRDTIDLRYWSQLFDFSQYGTIASVLSYAKQQGYFGTSPEKTWQRVQNDIERLGWDYLEEIGFDQLSTRQESRKNKQHPDKIKSKPWRYIVKTRPFDWHAAISRLRGLTCSQIKD